MQTTEQLVHELEKLILREEFSKALALLNENGLTDKESIYSVKESKDLLLSMSRTYYFNRDFKKAKYYIDILEAEHSELLDSIDYVAHKYQLLISEYKTVKAVELIKRALEIERGDKERYELEYYLGKAYFWNGDYLNARHCLERCCSEYRAKDDRCNLGRTFCTLGYIAFQRSFFDQSEEYFNRALENFRVENENHKAAHIYKLMCILNYRRGDYESAKENIELAQEHFGKFSSSVHMLNCRIARARIAIFEGELDTAKEILSSVRAESSEEGLKRVHALSSEFLGEISYRKGDHEKALWYLDEALALALDTAPRGDVAVEVYRRMGDVYIALGRTAEAEDMLAKAIQLCESLGDKYELGSVYRAYGLIAVKRRDIDLARSFFNEAILTFKLIKESFELAGTYIMAAEEYQKWIQVEDLSDETCGDLHRNAREFAIEALNLYTKLGLPHGIEKSRELIKSIDDNSSKSAEGPCLDNIDFDDRCLHGGIFVADSKISREVIKTIENVAGTDIPVLISGETGTGKEVVARLIHKWSGRSAGEFVAVNCAAISASVFESELFGHRKGAFTGAVETRKGLLEQANGGTLFLDEISELSPAYQAKLLRALEEKKIRRVGEVSERDIDIRVISATNENIEDLLENKSIRKDLYYRIAAKQISLKPLRERKEDIKPLMAYFLSRSGTVFRMEKGLLDKLLSYHWPGNVRELVNMVRLLVSLRKDSGIIRCDDLPRAIRSGEAESFEINSESYSAADKIRTMLYGRSLDGNRDELRELLSSLISKHSGNKSAVSRELGVTRKTLYSYLEKLEIS